MLQFFSDRFSVDETIINRLLVKHTKDCPICAGSRVVEDENGDPVHCECWHRYNQEYQLYAANIPPEYHFKTTANLSESWRAQQDEQVFLNLGQYRKRIEDARKEGFGLYLKGEKGAGTTFIGTLLLMHAIECGMTAYFIQFRDLIDACLSLRDEDVKEDVNNLITNIDFLMLDDVDSVPDVKNRDIVESIVPNMLKKRSYAKAPIIATATYGIEQLPGRIGESLAAVLTERVSLLPFRGNVKRQGVKDLEKEFFKTDE